MAPEIILKKPYKGTEVDIFATGIILFMMVLANQPFTKAAPRDAYYKCIALNKADIFWKSHTKKTGDIYSADFKDLIFRILAVKTENRITLEEIEYHSWFTQETASSEEMLAIYQKRISVIEAHREVDRLEKHANKI